MKRFHTKFHKNWLINSDFRILGRGWGEDIRVQTLFPPPFRLNFQHSVRKYFRNISLFKKIYILMKSILFNMNKRKFRNQNP